MRYQHKSPHQVDSQLSIAVITSTCRDCSSCCAFYLFLPECQALEAAFDELYPGAIDVDIVDVWTAHAPWPLNKFVQAYQFMAKRPLIWRCFWEYGRFPPTRRLTAVSQKTEWMGDLVKPSLSARRSRRNKEKRLPSLTAMTPLKSRRYFNHYWRESSPTLTRGVMLGCLDNFAKGCKARDKGRSLQARSSNFCALSSLCPS